MRERLARPPAPELIVHVYGPGLAEQRRLVFEPLIEAGLAHVVMLARQGIVTRDVARALLGGLQELRRLGANALEGHPELEDLQLNIESWLAVRLGAEAGGWLHAGRSRNDLYAAVQRMWLRARLTELADRLSGFREGVLDVARQHVHTVMTGYTHMQPAQPISVGHYFHGVAQALARENRRFALAYGTTNQSPLGAAALAGTTFPVDRELLAALLGFDGCLGNTLDAVATRDFIGEALFAAATTALVLNRVSVDLQLWATFEYGYLELPDDAAGISSIMPQKKNPVALEHAKAKVGHVVAALLSWFTCCKGTSYSHNRESSAESLHLVAEACNQLTAAFDLVTCSLRGARLDGPRMRQAIGANLSLATDLVETAAQQARLPFRAAHQLVARAVRDGLEHGDAGTVSEIAATLVQTGGPALPEEALAGVASPEEAIARRSHTGGPAPAEVERGLAEQAAILQADRQAWQDRRSQLTGASERLAQAVAL